MRTGRATPLARQLAILFGGVAVLAWALACSEASRPPAPTPADPAVIAGPIADAPAPVPEAPVLHTGDLDWIRRGGQLRLMALRTSRDFLPRRDSPSDAERRLASGFAEELGLEVEWIFVDRFEELIPAVLAGRGDLVVDNFTATPKRRQHVAFSVPVAAVSQLVVASAADDGPKRESDLAGRRVAVRPSSSFWATAETLRESVPGLEIEAAPEELDTDGLLDGVASGEFDLTLADSNLVHAALGWRDDVRVAFDVGDPQMIAWAMRPDSVELRRAVDRYLAVQSARAGSPAVARDDLPGIAERGVLRVLTRNSASTYFIWKGELLGFEYDLVKRFAEQRGLRLEVVVPPTRGDLIPWLLNGRGDIVAAGLTRSPERAEAEGVAFSRKYLGAREVVITRSDDTPIDSLDDLAGREVVVRRSSSYWDRVGEWIDSGIDVARVAAPEQLETEEVIAGVAEGRYDVTLADSHIADVELSYRRDVRAAFTLPEPVEHGWAVRPDNPELLASVDAFFDREYRGLFYNVTLKKYFKDPRKVARLEYRSLQGAISPYDELVRKYARRYGFDWRLIVAQMHQESRFDPTARSFAGAQGLLQVLPRTARELGFEGLGEPDIGVHAGVRYLAWIRDRLGTEGPERTWLSLAAYNAGYGHLRDARRIARQRGLDPDRWFDHVEQAMLLKEVPEVYQHTRFGYARGSEPVDYVRAIRDRYDAYLRVAEPL